jgi:phage pi2 protein 07
MYNFNPLGSDDYDSELADIIESCKSGYLISNYSIPDKKIDINRKENKLANENFEQYERQRKRINELHERQRKRNNLARVDSHLEKVKKHKSGLIYYPEKNYPKEYQ